MTVRADERSETATGQSDAAAGGRRKARRRSADERRRALVDATLRCIAEHGLEETSVRRICEIAGVSLGLVSHYFDGKEALVAAAYDQVAGELHADIVAEAAKAEGGPRARLSAFFRASFSSVNLDPGLLRVWLAFWTMSQHSAAAAAAHNRSYGAYRRTLEDLLRELAAERGLAAPDVRVAAIGLAGLLDGLWLEWCLNSETFTPEEGARLCEAWVDGLLERLPPA